LLCRRRRKKPEFNDSQGQPLLSLTPKHIFAFLDNFTPHQHTYGRQRIDKYLLGQMLYLFFGYITHIRTNNSLDFLFVDQIFQNKASFPVPGRDATGRFTG
jgi:hypothetical protein